MGDIAKRAAGLAGTKPHGTRVRYMGGCKCRLCRTANTTYEKIRSAGRRDGDWNGLVSAIPVRSYIYLLAMSKIGRHRISLLSGVSKTVVHEIKMGRKLQIRARTARLILAVQKDGTVAPHFRFIGFCKPCQQGRAAAAHSSQFSLKSHFCFATRFVEGVPWCDGCAAGTHCNYFLGTGRYAIDDFQRVQERKMGNRVTARGGLSFAWVTQGRKRHAAHNAEVG